MAKDVAKLSFWGVRGSTPTVDRATWRYGGNTSCLELITPDGGRLILDCGTGLRILGNRLAASPEKTVQADILVTHYHWDHIQGIPFFAPLYSPHNKFHFYSFRSEFIGQDSLKRVFEAQMAHPYFPVDLHAMSANREFTDVAGGDCFSIGKTRVTTCWLNHPQGCLGYRIETAVGTIVYATDNQPGNLEYDRNLRRFAEAADIFINDAQYTPQELERHRGWGHSSWREGVRIAEAAGVRNLVLFHHDPDSSDKAIDGILRDAREQFENTWAAAEGMVMTLGEEQTDVVIPAVREGMRREAHFRAHVTGLTQEGKAFEEETVIRDLSLHGALIYLDHSPKLQSELQVTIENPSNGNHIDRALRGYVVRIEPGPEKDQVGVGIVFTE
ncbi:MAG TPA: MBL fold metallo-hydrolase [Candidatus Acidoferrales bacterium]|jgi:phosphoribosyl 1,2-cyclic phosphodiesterase|nr:MBL fold metallo-hydrolase [Candidatus Acidoferrales bacterium]